MMSLTKDDTSTSTDINNREILYNTPKESWSTWRTQLYEHGWCIVPSVISRELAGHYRNQFWDWLEMVSGNKLKRDDRSTWIEQNFPANSKGIFTGYSFGHNQFVWDLRSEESVIAIFRELYEGTDELLVSFDGGNASRPQQTPRAPWWHIDQSSDQPEFKCIQGLMNLEECGQYDGGLVVYDGSHRRVQEYFKDTGAKSEYEGYYSFEQDPTTMKYFKDCKEIKVCCQPGDLVLWDSRTIHWAASPCQERGNGKVRLVTYLCYQPRSFAKPYDIRTKQQAFQRKEMTTHWPSENICITDSTFVDEGDVDYKFATNIDKSLPTLSERAKKLAGLVEY